MKEDSIGFAVGFMVAIIAVAVIKRIAYGKGRMKTEYDEMQKLAQGAAYKYGFLTAVAMTAICAVLGILRVKIFADEATSMFFILLVSVGVYAGYSIWKEAYFGLHSNADRYVRFLIVIIAINLFSGISTLRSGTMLTDGRLNYRCVNLGCAVLLIVILAIMAVKKARTEREE